MPTCVDLRHVQIRSVADLSADCRSPLTTASYSYVRGLNAGQFLCNYSIQQLLPALRGLLATPSVRFTLGTETMKMEVITMGGRRTFYRIDSCKEGPWLSFTPAFSVLVTRYIHDRPISVLSC